MTGNKEAAFYGGNRGRRKSSNRTILWLISSGDYSHGDRDAVAAGFSAHVSNVYR
jgi:hypothetical protein